MNRIKVGKKIFTYESFFRPSKGSQQRDFDGRILPFPENKGNWGINQKMFVDQLTKVEYILKIKQKYNTYDKKQYKNCLLCNHKSITKGVYNLNNVYWEDGLMHYIKVHNYKPTEKFTDMIFRYKTTTREPSRLKGTRMKKFDLTYLKIDKNQLMILDSLMVHGSQKKYKDKDKRKLFRYSEHAGLLDFSENELYKVVVYGDTRRVDEGDDDIFLPGELEDAPDYEYIFHTHPATPRPGGRVNIGILYEFPSLGDIFNFIDNHNDGYTQGSIVVCAEGLYVIKQKIHSLKKIRVDEDSLFRKYNSFIYKVQNDAVAKYGRNFTNKKFYSKIAQDKRYINRINRMLDPYGLTVDYYPRVQNEKGDWILDTVYLPVIPVE